MHWTRVRRMHGGSTALIAASAAPHDEVPGAASPGPSSSMPCGGRKLSTLVKSKTGLSDRTSINFSIHIQCHHSASPVHRSCPRPPSDTRYSLSRVDSPSSATACPEGSTGRSRLCRRSEGSRTRHGPHERTLEPKAHARPSMWRPCSPDGEVYTTPRPPLRDSAPYSAKTASPLELTLRTFFLHT